MAENSNRGKGSGEKLISNNPIARHNYIFHELVEAGMVLTGTEIKSMRNTAPNLKDAYVEVTQDLEAWLVNVHIAPYSHGNIWNHEPMRRRKLLLHRHQLERLQSGVIKEGMSIIPTRIYLKKGMAKIELALAKGKKKHDKRESLKQKSAQKEMAQALKKSRS